MKNLYYIRHGESTANIINQLGNDDAELTEKGAAQAAKAGRYLQTEGINPDIILVSPLQRAKETAMFIAQEIGYDMSKILMFDVLRERWFGELELGNIVKDVGVSLEYYFQHPLSVDHIENVEKLADLHKRAEKVVALAKSRPEDTVVIVSHGALLRSIYKVIEDIPYDRPIPPFENAKVLRLI